MIFKFNYKISIYKPRQSNNNDISKEEEVGIKDTTTKSTSIYFTEEAISDAFEYGVNICTSVFGGISNTMVSGGSFSVLDSGKSSVTNLILALQLRKDDNPIDIGFGYPALICILSALLQKRIVGTEINSQSVFSTLFNQAIERASNLTDDEKQKFKDLIPKTRSGTTRVISKNQLIAKPLSTPNNKVAKTDNNIINNKTKETVVDLASSEDDNCQTNVVMPPRVNNQNPLVIDYGEIQISRSDIEVLKSKTAWLNDNIIEFAIKYLCNKFKSSHLNCDCTSSFMYEKIQQQQQNKNFFQKHKSILDLDVLFIPINYPKDIHWILIIVCNPKYLFKLDESNNTEATLSRHNKYNECCLLIFDSKCEQAKKIGTFASKKRNLLQVAKKYMEFIIEVTFVYIYMIIDEVIDKEIYYNKIIGLPSSQC